MTQYLRDEALAIVNILQIYSLRKVHVLSTSFIFHKFYGIYFDKTDIVLRIYRPIGTELYLSFA